MLNKNVALELGYRLVHLGKMATGARAPDLLPTDPDLAPLEINNVYANEAFLGIRYSF